MTRIQPFPVSCAEEAHAALSRPAGTAVFVLSRQARSALCGRFGLEDSQLHRLYEKARYSQEGCTSQESRSLKR